MNLLRRIYERLLNIIRRLCASLHENQPILFSKRPPLLRRNCPPMLQIILIPNQHNDHIALTVLPRLLKPSTQVLEGVSTRDVVDEERASRATVVGAGDGAEGLLSGRVPDLEFDLFVGDGDHAGTKLDADCEIVDGLEAFVGELEEEAGFSHSCVTNNDVFE
mmetsp:Transcript_14976/g.31771  ORF Transcript_14976/g.31771 Transcript_14976/m.31771 type:complete len:163 (+) Transcript_14976:552-1040(+)